MKTKLNYFTKIYKLDFFSYILNSTNEEIKNILEDPSKDFNEQQKVVLREFLKLYDINYSKYEDIEDIKLLFNISNYFFEETNTHLFYNYNRFCGGENIDLSKENNTLIILGTRIFEKILPLVLFNKSKEENVLIHTMSIYTSIYKIREYPYYKELLNEIPEFFMVQEKLKSLDNVYGSTVRSSSYPRNLDINILLKSYEKTIVRGNLLNNFPSILKETIDENVSILREKSQSLEGIMLFDKIGIENNITLPVEFLYPKNIDRIFQKFTKVRKNGEDEIRYYNFGLRFNYNFNFKRDSSEFDKNNFENNIDLQIQKVKEDMYLAFILSFGSSIPLLKETYIYSPFVERMEIYSNDNNGKNKLNKLLNQENINSLLKNYHLVLEIKRNELDFGVGVKNLVESLESSSYRTSFNLLKACLENLFNYSIKGGKGINYHLQECTSIICRRDLRAKIRGLYKVRSDNLHGSIYMNDYEYKVLYEELLEILSKVLQELYFNNPRLLSLKRMDRVKTIMGY